MSFIDAIRTAPADADFIAYPAQGGTSIIQRRSDGIAEVIANCNGTAYSIFCAGASAQRMSVWSYDSQMFIVGNVEQLMRHATVEVEA